VTVAIASSGCGEEGGGSEPEAPRGLARIALPGVPSRLDPQLTGAAGARPILRSLHTPLLAYRHAEGEEGAELVPALAEELPAVSENGRTYSLRLRKGMLYSDGTPIRASDFEFAIDRLRALNPADAGRYANIAAISADDGSGEITIRLAEPRGSFIKDLALPLAAPVPRNSEAGGSRSGPPSSGPLAVAPAGNLPGLLRLRRNPRFISVLEAGAELPEAKVDGVAISTSAGHPERFVPAEGNSLDVPYIWMNTQSPPFNDARVRQAVNHALDRERLVEILDGRLDPGEEILPEGMPGHETLALYPPDLARARELIREANPLDTEVTVWTDDSQDHRRIAGYYRNRLAGIGLAAAVRVIPHDAYAATVGALDAPGLDTGVAEVRPGSAHPSELLELLDGDRIAPVGNRNLSRVDIPELNAELDRLAESGLDRSEDGYAELDRDFMEEAVWAPLGQARITVLVSDRVDLDRVAIHPLFGLDLTSLVLEPR
jgi:peptide/nickel transport system substrate-binding protein